MDRPPYFFVHIPKTAGTSFRLSVEEQFGSENLIYDYGSGSNITNRLILENVYEKEDLYALKGALPSDRPVMVAGHVSLYKYAALSGADRVISFLRRPEDQIISHFRHHRRHHGFTGTFEEFASRRGMAEIQSRVLQAPLPLEAIGFLGLTERYSESIALLNQTLGLNLRVLEKNVSPTDGETAITPEMREIAIRATRVDRNLYDRVAGLFERRLRQFDAGRPYVHGAILRLLPRAIIGFAYRMNDTDPVFVRLTVNGREITDPIPAASHRPDLAGFGVTRAGFVGYHIHLERPLSPGDVVEAFAAEDEQPIGKQAFDPEK
ncbi:hypothetical protein HPQ64_12615 [Rhizobiales bacterium]|uniref:hypothetical protein n=1 Tax=Hongsoonwoonella zoysiae TaxID=2821844 RepID=UPI00155F78B9|nr:hypothetical protein [Hongsoonwoonella zoysiae]NRG18532.1 hypothetical protein [Hongsoonwoonella zoysiae]